MSKMEVNGMKMDNHSKLFHFNLDNVALSLFLTFTNRQGSMSDLPVCASVPSNAVHSNRIIESNNKI